MSREQILAHSFSGPLPPPQFLSEYEKAFPGRAERIVAMAERQSLHRQEMEASHLRARNFVERRGQIFAFLVTVVAIVSGAVLISIYKDASGLAAILTALAVLAGTFVYGRHVESKERERKRKPFEERAQGGKLQALSDTEQNRKA